MATTEHTINDALAEVLKKTRRAWEQLHVIRSENIDILKDSGKRPDILINEPNVSPVVVETEIIPAATVESDAINRLGKILSPSGKRILSSLAIRLPEKLRDYAGDALKEAICSISDYNMALFTGESKENYTRFPENGWLSGDINEMSVLIQAATIPQIVIDEAANKLVTGVSEAAAILNEMTNTHPGAIKKICEELKQQDSEQTRRMATTIVANALVFHESLSRGEGDLYDVRTLDEFRTVKGGINKAAVLNDWQIILSVNYWPIFDIARRILEVIPANIAKALLERLIDTASELVANSLMRSHDLTGAVFQRLIADRKFLAAFYTHPASAALLVGLAISPENTPGGGEWGKEEDVKKLRIADFACGTGTLLSTAYHRVSQLYEMAGGNTEMMHPEMMAKALVGCDVLPAAAHLTASMLASAHPTVKYDHSSVMTVAYGPREDGGVALGSLDLLDPQRPFDIIAITAKTMGGKGAKEKEIWSELPHMSFDMVIMNPPFTRDTGNEGKKVGVQAPMFAAFNFTEKEQKLMVRATDRILQDTSYHGNAGEASAFLVLADRKLKENGTLALVMPLSLMSGEAWEDSRELLKKNYSDITIISISGARPRDLSFSADTGMGECLVIAKKNSSENKRATFVVLKSRPISNIIGAILADEINGIKHNKIQKLEDGPVGGNLIQVGDDVLGFAIEAPLLSENSWNLTRLADASLAQTAYQIIYNGLVWLPGIAKENAPSINISKISKIGQTGPYHMDINANTADGKIRGPFRVVKLQDNIAPTYPVLWWHDLNRERTLEFEADSEGIIRRGVDSAEDMFVQNKASKIFTTASHCHFNRDFQFNAESTAMQFTSKKTIGGHAWPSIKLATAEQEKVLTLWGNSTLGILLHWWHANKQQAGRGRIGVSALASLPVMDITKLSEEVITKAAAIFDEMKTKELRPINEIDKDPVRKEIDEKLYALLGFPKGLLEPDGPLDLVRQKLAKEPSIHGGKKS